MHIVHIKDPYTSLDEIKTISDGLAVLGVFLKADENAEDNEAFEMLIKAFSKCTFKGI